MGLDNAECDYKRQITIPAEILGFLGLKAGQKPMVEVEEDRIVLTPRPVGLTKAFGGVTKGFYGDTAAEVDRYIDRERGPWGE